MSLHETYIIDGIRTPIGRYGGALSGVRADDLGAVPLKALLARHPQLDPALVEDVYLGCANQAGEDNRNVARMSLLLAGLPVTVPGSTINRLCGSGLDAIGTVARGIAAGELGLAIAGGVESMSRAPFVMGKATSPFARDQQIEDTTMGWRFINPRLRELPGVATMGQSAADAAAADGSRRARRAARVAARAAPPHSKNKPKTRDQKKAVPVHYGATTRRQSRARRDRPTCAPGYAPRPTGWMQRLAPACYNWLAPPAPKKYPGGARNRAPAAASIPRLPDRPTASRRGARVGARASANRRRR